MTTDQWTQLLTLIQTNPLALTGAISLAAGAVISIVLALWKKFLPATAPPAVAQMRQLATVIIGAVLQAAIVAGGAHSGLGGFALALVAGFLGAQATYGAGKSAVLALGLKSPK